MEPEAQVCEVDPALILHVCPHVSSNECGRMRATASRRMLTQLGPLQSDLFGGERWANQIIVLVWH